MGVWNPGPAATTGDDIFTGDFHDESANGLAGDDTLIGSYGDDTLVGGSGADWIYAGQTEAGEDPGDNDEDGQDKLKGGDGDDHLFNFNGAVSSTLLGQGGNDTIHAMSGDLIDGGAGDDIIELGFGDGYATLIGGEGFDEVRLGWEVRLADFSATSGIERFVSDDFRGYANITADGLVDLSHVELVNITRFIISADAEDTVIGAATNDVIYAEGESEARGGGGADTLRGSSLECRLFGDEGDDLFSGYGYMAGGAGNDRFGLIDRATVNGGGGQDTINLGGAIGGVVFNLTECAKGIKQFVDGSSYVYLERMTYGAEYTGEADNLTGYKYDDGFSGHDGNDTLRGMAGDDHLNGRGDFDLISGDGGDDILLGGGAGDTLSGGVGDDTLNGEAGVDVLIGGQGNDYLSGGRELDTFIFEKNDLKQPSVDTIADFALDGLAELIDLSRVDADRTTAGNQAFSYIGEQDFSGTAGELQVIQTDLHRFIARGDIDGDGLFDFSIDIVSPTLDVEASDFVL